MTRTTDPPAASAARGGSLPRWMQIVRDRVSGLRFGTVQIVVHDGRVTQIERTEKVRLSAESSPDGDPAARPDSFLTG